MDTRFQVTHGKSRDKIYKIWQAMMRRCYSESDPSYKNYGARGIFVSESWHSFPSFYRDMGDRPDGRSLDRKDNDSGYSRENCRWATRVEQAANQRPRKLNKNNKTGVKGVSWKADRNLFAAQLNENKKLVRIGYYATIQEASDALDERRRVNAALVTCSPG